MKTILMVDDNKLNLVTAKRVLGDEYRVIPVTKGQEALTYLKDGECDIILLDINMPEMDGFEVLKRIREMEQDRHIPVVFLTADRDAETETRCFKVGAMDFIAKPFVPAVMLSRIGRILELEDLRRSLADQLEQKTREAFDIKSRSYHDTLTGLWDREYTEEKINEILERRIKGALLMIDIDNFKAVNDTYGHVKGDKLLKMIAETLQHFSAERDVLCRFDGDEFVVFMKEVVSKFEIVEYAENISSDIRKKIEECGFQTNCSISIGIARAPEDGTEFAKLYNAADKALYYVKQNGKNSYYFFGDNWREEIVHSKEIVDLKYLQELMSRDDSGKGAYLLDFESFHHVYHFIRRFVDRNNRDVLTLLFTINGKEDTQLDAEKAESALSLLEKAVSVSLRRSDVSTRYSSRQLIVILMDAAKENGDLVAERILGNFNELYTDGKVHIVYNVARIDSRVKPSENWR